MRLCYSAMKKRGGVRIRRTQVLSSLSKLRFWGWARLRTSPSCIEKVGRPLTCATGADILKEETAGKIEEWIKTCEQQRQLWASLGCAKQNKGICRAYFHRQSVQGCNSNRETVVKAEQDFLCKLFNNVCECLPPPRLTGTNLFLLFNHCTTEICFLGW